MISFMAAQFAELDAHNLFRPQGRAFRAPLAALFAAGGDFFSRHLDVAA